MGKAKTKKGRTTPKGATAKKRKGSVGHAPHWLKKRELEASGLLFGDGKPTAIRCSCGWSTVTMGVQPIVVGVPPRREGATAREKTWAAFEEHVRSAPSGLCRRGPVGLAAAPPLPSRDDGGLYCGCGWKVPAGLSEREAQAAFEEHRNAELAEVG